ncbi:hypothetical protein LINGRAHAP2_LOCUS31720 [Linum grandiflorum]
MSLKKKMIQCACRFCLRQWKRPASAVRGTQRWLLRIWIAEWRFCLSPVVSIRYGLNKATSKSQTLTMVVFW